MRKWELWSNRVAGRGWLPQKVGQAASASGDDFSLDNPFIEHGHAPDRESAFLLSLAWVVSRLNARRVMPGVRRFTWCCMCATMSCARDVVVV